MIKPIGLFGNNLGWQQILDQERINYELINGLTNLERYGVIIIGRSLNDKEISSFRDCIEEGGAILTDFLVLHSLIPDFRYHRLKNGFIIPTSDNLYNNVGLIDIGKNGFATYGLNNPEVYSEDHGLGTIIALPFDLNQAQTDTSMKPKFFYYPTKKFPYETVAEVSKGEVRKLALNCLRILCQQQKLYYSHIWYYPKGNLSVFTFRVDTDFAPWEQIHSVIQLARENELGFTWFINTKAQETDLSKFPELAKSGQDLQLHCYIHNVFSDYLHNRDNIEKGKNRLKEVGIEPIGFAAPFGEWNEDLAEVLEDLNFKYSSEFVLAYDDLPFYPVVVDEKTKVLQIPVHPICVGRLLQADFDYNQILLYFKRYIELCYQAREPIMIYDHPHRIHQVAQVFDSIFKEVKKLKNVWLTDFTQFMSWWQKRAAVIYHATIENDRLQIVTPNNNPDFSLHLISPAGQETFVPLKNGLYPLDKMVWSEMPEPIMVDEGIERIRANEFFLKAREFINTLNRKMKGQRT
jgi:Polysaccharide deacetylase